MASLESFKNKASMKTNLFFLLMLSGRYWLAAAIKANVFVHQFNATNLNFRKAKFQFKFKMNVAKLSPSIFMFNSFLVKIRNVFDLEELQH